MLTEERRMEEEDREVMEEADTGSEEELPLIFLTSTSLYNLAERTLRGE